MCIYLSFNSCLYSVTTIAAWSGMVVFSLWESSITTRVASSDRFFVNSFDYYSIWGKIFRFSLSEILDYKEQLNNVPILFENSEQIFTRGIFSAHARGKVIVQNSVFEWEVKGRSIVICFLYSIILLRNSWIIPGINSVHFVSILICKTIIIESSSFCS